MDSKSYYDKVLEKHSDSFFPSVAHLTLTIQRDSDTCHVLASCHMPDFKLGYLPWHLSSNSLSKSWWKMWIWYCKSVWQIWNYFFLFLVIICFFSVFLLHFYRGCALIYTTFIRKSAEEKYLMPSSWCREIQFVRTVLLILFFLQYFGSFIYFFMKKLQIILKNPLKLIFWL